MIIKICVDCGAVILSNNVTARRCAICESRFIERAREKYKKPPADPLTADVRKADAAGKSYGYWRLDELLEEQKAREELDNLIERNRERKEHLGNVKEITVYVNSGGGDVFAAQAIGNMLERNSATVTVHIDGLCASAATIIACHADKVVSAADGSYMVHPPSMGICDFLTAADMRNCLKALDTIRDNIVALYAKKTGKTVDECGKWMDETSWWTASEAKENGFVDEVDSEDEDAVVENRNGQLFVNSIGMGLLFDKAPDFVKSRMGAKAPGGFSNAENPGTPGTQEEETMDISTDEGNEEGDPLGKVHAGLRTKAGMAAGTLCILRGRKAHEGCQSAGQQTPHTSAGHDGICGTPHIHHCPQGCVPPHPAAADPRRA